MRGAEDYIEMMWGTEKENWNVKNRKETEVEHKGLC